MSLAQECKRWRAAEIYLSISSGRKTVEYNIDGHDEYTTENLNSAF